MAFMNRMSRRPARSAARAAAWAAACLAAALAFGSCSLLPLPEIGYTVTREGGAEVFFDDFEDNDGKVSNSYYYEGDFSLSQLWNSGGVWSLYFKSEKPLKFLVAPLNEALLSFDSSDYIYSLKVDGVERSGDLSYSSSDSIHYSLGLAAGKHTIEMTPQWYGGLYIDNLGCRYDSADVPCTPGLGAYAFSPPTFSWPTRDGATIHEFQLSANADMSSPVVDAQDLASASYALSTGIPAGTWYWRNRPRVGNIWGGWTGIRSFNYIPGYQSAFDAAVSGMTWTFRGNPVINPTAGSAGGYAVVFPSGDSYATVAAEFAEPCAVTFERSGSFASVSLDEATVSAPDLAATVSGWYNSCLFITTPGSHSIEYRSYYSSGLKLGDLAVRPCVAPVSEGFEGGALSSSAYFLYGPSSEASLSTAAYYAGSASLLLCPYGSSGSINSGICLPVYLSEPKTLSFYGRMDSNTPTYNSVTIYDNGDSTTRPLSSTATTWTQCTLSLSAGYHLIRITGNGYYRVYGYYIDALTFN